MAKVDSPMDQHKIPVLYRDDGLLIVDKPWDMCINGESEDHHVTVASLLAKQFPELVDEDVSYGFRFVHRLDYATSGVLCLALDKDAAREMTELFSNRSVKKQYLAIVRGHLKQQRFVVSESVGQDSSDPRGFLMCTSDSEHCLKARPAETSISVLTHGFYNGSPVSKVLLEPLTGRRHQLRVHCLSMGAPIVGDFTYSGGSDKDPYRMMLHAWKMSIPLKNKDVEVASSDPFTTEQDSLLHYV